MPLNEFSCDESIEANEDRDSPNELEGQQESGRVNQYIDHGLPVQVVAPTGHFPRNSNVPPSNSAGSNPTNVVCHPVDCSRSCMVSTNHAQRSLALKRLCQSVQRSAHGKKTNRRYSKRVLLYDSCLSYPTQTKIDTVNLNELVFSGTVRRTS
ncbi:unnamed protein product [Adineta ricciae]|uniref:Uncharacterized protein n=1 Tax=Adineta ricciae TaxID=249248 RepID=A0A815G9U6_ADIRI|nr:unnamed protein product [Adineta ricciae]